MFAAGAVDFMCRERRGAAVQCGGKNRDRYLLTCHDFNKAPRSVLSPRLLRYICVISREQRILDTLLMVQLQQQTRCEMPAG